MKTNILIVSHQKDLPWLTYALASIKKFATGFGGVTVVFPEGELFQADVLPDNFTLVRFGEFPKKGMLDAMAQKLLADIHCPDADFIFHTDSDCVFREPFCPEDYFCEGKPVLLMERYSDLERGKNPRFQWQAVVGETLGFKPDFETMCRPSLVHPRDIYAKVRQHIEERWYMPFRHYVLTCENAFPQSFAEFNTIGAWAYQFARDRYYWLQVPINPRPHDKCIQFWSHSPPDVPQPVWIDGTEKLLIPKNLIERILNAT